MHIPLLLFRLWAKRKSHCILCPLPVISSAYITREMTCSPEKVQDQRVKSLFAEQVLKGWEWMKLSNKARNDRNVSATKNLSHLSDIGVYTSSFPQRGSC